MLLNVSFFALFRTQRCHAETGAGGTESTVICNTSGCSGFKMFSAGADFYAALAFSGCSFPFSFSVAEVLEARAGCSGYRMLSELECYVYSLCTDARTITYPRNTRGFVVWLGLMGTTRGVHKRRSRQQHSGFGAMITGNQNSSHPWTNAGQLGPMGTILGRIGTILGLLGRWQN